MPRRRDHHPTLKDIADRLGISAMTVSRALSNKRGMVNGRTVRRVRAAAKEMGYAPNLLARSLRGERLPTIVVHAELISSHQYLAELVDTAARAIEARDYGVIACQSVESLTTALRQFHLAGALMLAPPERAFHDEQGHPRNGIETPTPLVVIHHAARQTFFPEVSPDLTDAAFMAAQHLLELGHTRLAFVGGPPREIERLWFAKRRAGIEQALTARQLPSDGLRHVPCPTPELAPTALQQLLAADPRITGVICHNDEIAIAAMHGARSMGLHVPRDLSFVGSNDMRLSRFLSPTLTTLRIDIAALVETGLNLLFDRIRDEHAAPAQVLQKCELVIRESTAPPPAR